MWQQQLGGVTAVKRGVSLVGPSLYVFWPVCSPASLLASLVNRPSSKSAWPIQQTFWRVNRNEAEMLEQSLLNRPADLLDKTAFLFGRFATSSTHMFHKNIILYVPRLFWITSLTLPRIIYSIKKRRRYWPFTSFFAPSNPSHSTRKTYQKALNIHHFCSKTGQVCRKKIADIQTLFSRSHWPPSRIPISAQSLPKLHPKINTQAPITFHWTEIIKCNWYEKHSEKLCDQ